MTNRTFNILGSPGFLTGLSLLIANDFVFKEQFHNAFTGKLSDFAGLFVFSLFWIAFLPRRKTLICVSTAMLFAFWKSAYSQFLLDGWNSLPFFGIQRTVDYSDLWALLIVPLSYSYSDVSFRVHLPRRFVYPIAIMSVIAFTATSFSQKASFENQYQFQTSKNELVERMSRLPTDAVSRSFWLGDEFRLTFDSCNGWALFKVEERVSQSVITLIQIENRCSTKLEPEEMREYFEKEFIDKIREEPVRQSPKIRSIWSTSSNVERALLLDPQNKTAPRFVARTIHAQYKPGDFTSDNVVKAREAIIAYRKVLQGAPTDEEAYKAIAYLYGAIREHEQLREWLLQRANNTSIDDPQRAEAFVVLASKDWDCSFKITEQPTTKVTTVRRNKAYVRYQMPKERVEFEQARDCANRGLEMANMAIALTPESETAWSYKTNILLELAKLAEMLGDVQQKRELNRQYEEALDQTTKLSKRSQSNP